MGRRGVSALATTGGLVRRLEMGTRPSRQPYTMAEVSRPTRDDRIDCEPHGLEHAKDPFSACVYHGFEAIEFVKHLIEDEG